MRVTDQISNDKVDVALYKVSTYLIIYLRTYLGKYIVDVSRPRPLTRKAVCMDIPVPRTTRGRDGGTKQYMEPSGCCADMSTGTLKSTYRRCHWNIATNLGQAFQKKESAHLPHELTKSTHRHFF